MSTDGIDILGASGPDPIITIKIKDPIGVAKKQGGTAATAADLMPASVIENEVYKEVLNRVVAKLAEQGVDAEVTIIDRSKLGLYGNNDQSEDPGSVFWGIAGGLGGLLGGIALGQHMHSRRK